MRRARWHLPPGGYSEIPVWKRGGVYPAIGGAPAFFSELIELTFLLDNYDSFTYNLAQYLGELGERVTVRRNDQVTLAEIERLRPRRILISPGPGTPDSAGISLASRPERSAHTKNRPPPATSSADASQPAVSRLTTTLSGLGSTTTSPRRGSSVGRAPH